MYDQSKTTSENLDRRMKEHLDDTVADDKKSHVLKMNFPLVRRFYGKVSDKQPHLIS